MLSRVKPEYLRRAYKLAAWADADDFLTQVARNAGKLGKGGDPDLNTAAKMVLYDWQRGKIPFFTLPPDYTPEEDEGAAAGGALFSEGVTVGALPAPPALVLLHLFWSSRPQLPPVLQLG